MKGKQYFLTIQCQYWIVKYHKIELCKVILAKIAKIYILNIKQFHESRAKYHKM